jgi:hypothetical protein
MMIPPSSGPGGVPMTLAQYPFWQLCPSGQQAVEPATHSGPHLITECSAFTAKQPAIDRAKIPKILRMWISLFLAPASPAAFVGGVDHSLSTIRPRW